MTPSELKRKVQEAGHDPYFFSRENMRFFGDTMRNYGVRTDYVEVQGMHDPYPQKIEVWELYRKHPVKHGNQSSAYFCKQTLRRVFP